MSSEANVANLLGLARTAQMGGNSEEALGYFNRVLELDPSISEAWLGKGKAAGWQSSLANIRLNEALVAFGHAIATASESSKPTVVTDAAEEINKLVSTLYGMARKQLEQFPSVEGVWPKYVGQVGEMIDALCEVKTWRPLDRTTLDNIVHLCKDNIEGYSFRDQLNNGVPSLHQVTDAYEMSLTTKMREAAATIAEIDPSYAAPAVEKKAAEACFVITATMGGVDNPEVRLLRQFRDEWIGRRRWGPAFVRAYYFVGPSLARAISGSRTLRALSYACVVLPAAWFARRKLR